MLIDPGAPPPRLYYYSDAPTDSYNAFSVDVEVRSVICIGCYINYKIMPTGDVNQLSSNLQEIHFNSEKWKRAEALLQLRFTEPY